MDLAVPASILADGDRGGLEEVATELYEWLSLVRLGSPRAAAKDDIDPYLSRYRAPGDSEGHMHVCRLSWQGFASASWLRGLLVDVLVSCPPQSWFSLSSTAFSKDVNRGSDEVTILKPPGATGEYLMWEMKH